MLNVLMRPVWNRPEMLKLSIEYETAARKYWSFFSPLITIFLAEYGTTKEVWDIIKDYPYPCDVVVRKEPFGLTPNILEGYKYSFSRSDSFVITVEDDILLHKTYFQYIDAFLSMKNLPKYSVINSYGPNNGSVDDVQQIMHYCPWAPLIDKEFFETYILPHANNSYYSNRDARMHQLNRDYIGKPGYIFTDARWNEQAGLIHRLCRIAGIDDGLYILSPRQNRERNIGYYGKNRPGGSIPGHTLQERVSNLRGIIEDPKEMLYYANRGTKNSADYALFHTDLDNWNGKLNITLRDE